MNLEAATMQELEDYRRAKECEYRDICDISPWGPDAKERLKACEDELYRVARQLDRVHRGGGVR